MKTVGNTDFYSYILLLAEGFSGILITQKLFLMKSVTPSNFAHYHFNTKGLGTFRRGHSSQSYYAYSMDVLRINSFSGTKIASGNTAQKTFFISLASSSQIFP